MQTDKASIFVDAQNLRRLFYTALKDMAKGDRVMYGESVMREIGDFIAVFVMAYDFPDERDYYIREMVARFAVMRLDLELMSQLNIYKGKLNKDGNPIVKGEIFECVGRIDIGISKVESFLASINSYTGVFKRRNGYAIIHNLIDSINGRWWKYVEVDKERLCLVAKEGYKHRQTLARKYNLNFKNHVKRRKRQSAQRAVRHSAQGAGCHQ